VTASNLDVLTVVAFAAAILINRQAAILLIAHLAWEIMFLLPLNDFWITLAASAIYAAAATAFIKLKSQLRYAMLCTAGLYYLGAIDAFLFPTVETLYYNSIGYFIGAVDLYALFIVCNGGRKRAGVGRPFTWWVFRLQSH
jgi:hypothetical protein